MGIASGLGCCVSCVLCYSGSVYSLWSRGYGVGSGCLRSRRLVVGVFSRDQGAGNGV